MFRLIAIIFIVALNIDCLALPGFAEAQQDVASETKNDLSRKLESLQEEQRYLLFLKTFYTADSKYLVLDLDAGKGSLMYRSRVLRTFGWEKRGQGTSRLPKGIITMTRKTDGSSINREMHFGSELSLAGRKRTAGREQQKVVLGLSKKDLAALFYALEVGSKAYVK